MMYVARTVLKCIHCNWVYMLVYIHVKIMRIILAIPMTMFGEVRTADNIIKVFYNSQVHHPATIGSLIMWRE